MSQEKLNAKASIGDGDKPIESDAKLTKSVGKKLLTSTRLMALINQLYDQKKQLCMSVKEQRKKLHEYMNSHIQDSDESQDEDEVEEDDSDSDIDSDCDSEYDSDSDSYSDESEVSSDEEDSDSESSEEGEGSSDSVVTVVNFKTGPTSTEAASPLRNPIAVVPADRQTHQSALSAEKDSESKCPALKLVAPISSPASSSQSAPRIQRRTTLAGGLLSSSRGAPFKPISKPCPKEAKTKPLRQEDAESCSTPSKDKVSSGSLAITLSLREKVAN